MAGDIDVGPRSRPIVWIVDDDASSRRAFARLIRSHRLEAQAFAGPGQLLRRLPSRRLHCAGLLLGIQLGATTRLDPHHRPTPMGGSLPTIFLSRPDHPAPPPP